MSVIFAITFLISTALACPDIAGRYNACVSSTGDTANSKEVVFDQKIINKIHHLNITSTDTETQHRSTDSFKADGKTWITKTTDADTGFMLITELTTTCTDQYFIIRNNMTLNGEHMSTMNYKITKINGEIIQEISDKVTCR